MSSQILTTPERHRYSEREADRLRRLQMTSPSRRRNCVRRMSVTDPIPQPQFVNAPPSQLPFDPQAVPPAPAPPQRRRNLQNPMVHNPALNARHIAIHTRNVQQSPECNAQAQAQSNSNIPAQQSTSDSERQAHEQERLQQAHAAQLQEMLRARNELERQEQERRDQRDQERRLQAERCQEEARLCRERLHQEREARQQEREERQQARQHEQELREQR